MKMRKGKIIILSLFVMLSLLAAACSRNAGAPPGTISIPSAVPQPSAPAAQSQTAVRGSRPGNLAPDFRFQDTSGKTVTLASLQGHPVVLNFWASWCPPCQAEMPFIERLWQDGTLQRNGLLFYAIDMGEKAETVQSFITSKGYTFPVLLDSNGDISDAYNVRAIPVTFFIDRAGVIKNRREGAFASDTDLVREIVKITQ